MDHDQPHRETGEPIEEDHTLRESLIGTGRGHERANASWGAIFAGTVSFLAVMLLFGLTSIALGLSDVGGVAVGIWSVVAILLALAIGGFIAGALAVRSGLLHGLVTWATSLVGLVVLVGWLGAGVLGAIGGAVGGMAQTAAETMGVEEAVEEADIDQQDVDQAQTEAEEAAQEAQDAFEERQDELAEGAWWGVAGLILGAAVAGFAGMAGARSVHTPHHHR